MDRNTLENVFGTNPEKQDLLQGIELLQEWIAEIEDDNC